MTFVSTSNIAAGRRAAIGGTIGALAAALLLSASPPASAAVLYSASGVVQQCSADWCYVDINNIPTFGGPKLTDPSSDQPWSGKYTLTFSTQSSPLLQSWNFFTEGWDRDDYTAAGAHIAGGSDDIVPDNGYYNGVVSGDTDVLDFSEYVTLSTSVCALSDEYPGCVERYYTVQYMNDIEEDLTGAAVGDNWTLTISSVPEPEAWVLLMAGLALLGASIRTRTSQVRRAGSLA